MPEDPADDEPRADPRLPRMLTDPITTAPHADSSRYRPAARLRAFIHTRDTTCLGPACPHPTTGTQIDHTINHHERDAHGILGLTVENNLGSLCERTHNAKTHGDWHLRQPTPGTFVWTSPTGRVYHRQARPLLPGWHTRHEKKGRGRPPPGDG